MGATPAGGDGGSKVVPAYLVKLEMDKVEYSTPVLYIISFLHALLVRFLLPLIHTLLRVAHAPGVPLLPFLYCLLQSSLPSVHVLTLRLSLSCTYRETYENTYGNFIFCFSSSLLCPCPCPADCPPVFLVVVLDLMIRPCRRPFFLVLIVTAFFPCCVAVSWHCALGLSSCWPQEGRPQQYPRPRLRVGNWGLFPCQIPMWMLMTLRLKVFFVHSPRVFLFLVLLALNRLCLGIYNRPWNEVGL
jgi:hypothetical protein